MAVLRIAQMGFTHARVDADGIDCGDFGMGVVYAGLTSECREYVLDRMMRCGDLLHVKRMPLTALKIGRKDANHARVELRTTKTNGLDFSLDIVVVLEGSTAECRDYIGSKLLADHPDTCVAINEEDAENLAYNDEFVDRWQKRMAKWWRRPA